MKTVELWLPVLWVDPLFKNDMSGLTQSQQYALRDFIDGRYVNHGSFTPIAVDYDTVETMVVHDAMTVVKEHPIECVKITFSVENYWRKLSNA